MNGGVYKILNTVNGRAYIGSTSCFKARWKVHRRDLRAGKHANQSLQNAWDKYGEIAFVFSIIEVVGDRLGLIDSENNAMRIARNSGVKLYNIRVASESNLGLKLGPRPKAVKKKISDSRMGIVPYNKGMTWKEEGRVLSDESRRKIGARSRAKTHCPHGHEYSATNTYIAKNGQRQCRACSAARMKRTRDRMARGVEGTHAK